MSEFTASYLEMNGSFVAALAALSEIFQFNVRGLSFHCYVHFTERRDFFKVDQIGLVQCFEMVGVDGIELGVYILLGHCR